MSRLMLSSAFAVHLLLLAAGGPAAEPGEIMELTGPVVVELDHQGHVVWKVTGEAIFLSIDVDRSGRRIVSDARHRMTVYGGDGRTLTETGFESPVDVDFLDNGNFLVTSAGIEGVVSEISASGEVVWSYGGLDHPRDADRLGNGNTLICDTNRNRVIEVDPDGRTVWSFDLGLNHPWDAEVYGDDLVVIADYDHHAVALVGRDRLYRWKVYKLHHPNRVQVLADGTILISESDDGVLRRVDENGRTLEMWPLSPRIQDVLLTKDDHLLLAFSPAPKSPGEFRMPTAVGSFLAPMSAPGPARSSTGLHRGALAGMGIVILVTLFYAVRRGSKRPGRWVLSRVVTPVAVVLVLGTLAMTRGSMVNRLLPSQDATGKNLVLVLFDSLRHDHVPFNGYHRNTTPRLMELIDESVVFHQYITHAPWTKPSVASLLTSTYPSNHRVVEESSESRLPSSLTTIAEVLKHNGYFTAAVMENPYMKEEGFGQGFDEYHTYPAKKYGGELPVMTADAALKILAERPRDRPFFLMLFFMNPHFPNEPKEGMRFQLGSGLSRKVDNYDSDIFEADAQVGRVLDAIREAGQMEETIVVFTTDHGESMGEHGEPFHGGTLYDATLKVPLLIYGLGQRGAVRGLVREIDLMPTLLDYLGAETFDGCSKQMMGISLRAAIESLSASTGLVAFAETRFSTFDRAARRSEHEKIVVDYLKKTVERYDMRLDPQELNDLVAFERAKLLAWREGQWYSPPEAATEGVSQEVLEELKAIGYLTDTSSR